MKVKLILNKPIDMETQNHIRRMCDFFNKWAKKVYGFDLDLTYDGYLWYPTIPITHKLLRIFTRIYGHEILWMSKFPKKPIFDPEYARFGFMDIFQKPLLIYCYILSLKDITPVYPKMPREVFWNMQFQPLISHELLHYILFKQRIKGWNDLPDLTWYDPKTYYTKDGKRVSEPCAKKANFYWVVQEI